MNVIKVKFDIDIDNEQQLKSFNNFVQELKNSGGTPAVVEAPVKDIKTKVETTQQTTAQPAATTTSKPVTTQPAATTTSKPEDVSKKLFEIRQLIGEKAANHREAMIKKLAEFGVETATDLPIDKYEEFKTFLVSLA